MTRLITRTALLAAPLWLSACLTDPFGLEPETDAELPAVEEPAPVTEELDGEPDDVLEAVEEIETAEPVAEEAVEPVEADLPGDDAEPAADRTSTALLVDHTSTDAIPRTDKLVRGIRNDAVITLKAGRTVTLALNTNRMTGYEWRLSGPFSEGGDLEFTADYYREGESAFPDKASIGGARYFVLTANAAGSYPLAIRHESADDVRATKELTLDVSAE